MEETLLSISATVIIVGHPERDWPSENPSRPIVYSQNVSSLKPSVRMRKDESILRKKGQTNCPVL